MSSWTDKAEESKKPENRRLINVGEIILVKESSKCEHRAELWLKDNKYNNVLTVVGSYEDISERILKAANVVYADGKSGDEKILEQFGFQMTPEAVEEEVST